MARRDADMTQGNILRQYIEFALPLTIGLLFQQLYSTVDTVVVGQFVGETALGAVGSTGNIINMLIGICNGLSLGAGAVISQAYGAKDEEKIHRAVHTTMLVTFLLCIVMTFVGLAVVTPGLRLMRTPSIMLEEASEYLTIYFSGIAGLLIYNMGSAILRAVGDSRRPLYFLVFSAAVNTVLDLVFVLCFHMGVAGVAYATIIAQAASAVLVLFVLTKEKSAYGLRWNKLRISGDVLKQILIIGLPASIQQGLTSFSNVFVQGYINDLGELSASGWAAYNRIDAFLMVPVMAIAQASTTFVAQNWGARKPERARKGVRTGIFLCLGCMAVCASLVMCFAHPLLSLICDSETVISYGSRFLYIITPFYLLITFNQLYSGALRGIGNSLLPTLIMLFSFVLFRQAYLFCATSFITDENLRFIAVALSYPAGWILCSLLQCIAYHRSRLFHPSHHFVKEA